MGWLYRSMTHWLLLLILSTGLGCQVETVSTIQLQKHQEVLDLTGLMPVQARERLRASVAPPEDWTALVPTQGFCYLHQQWRSPTHNAGMGVVYIHSPVPLSASTVVWFAKLQYAQQGTANETGGKLLGEWTDKLGREWFEAQDAKYHVRGYAMSRGVDAWIVYSGYRVAHKPASRELLLAARAADSVAPLVSNPAKGEH